MPTKKCQGPCGALCFFLLFRFCLDWLRESTVAAQRLQPMGPRDRMDKKNFRLSTAAQKMTLNSPHRKSHEVPLVTSLSHHQNRGSVPSFWSGQDLEVAKPESIETCQFLLGKVWKSCGKSRKFQQNNAAFGKKHKQTHRA